jgi:hypothetical protein
MPDINGIPYVESDDLVSAYPAVSQSLAQELSDQFASKLPYAFGTATPTTTDEGFLWYDSTGAPSMATPKFWDGSAFVPFGGKILQIVRATDSTQRSTTSTSFVDASISVTITPKKSDSAVILLWSANGAHTTTTSFADYQITDVSNNPVSGDQGKIGSSTTASITVQFLLVGYSTPATTAATTYKGRFRVAASGTAFLNNDLCTGQLYAIEVSA